MQIVTELLEKEVPDLIYPSVWPFNSTHSYRMDYDIWSVMRERAYQQPISNIDELQKRIATAVLEALDQRIIDTVIRQ